ncbi:MAG: flagellar hook-length control protein FliK [Lachnospiraceae bacterium]|nr:flagellar hook-length control protein FliK [Lachnospiraceae bacterium]
MKLSDIFSPSSRQVKREERPSVRSSGTSNENLNRQIKSLTPGKVLQGEVIEKNGGEVKIKLSDDMVLTARLDQDVNVEAGKMLTFEVRNNGSLLSLSPLFTNTANSDTVFKALQMAGLPINETTVAMTDSMMQQGMSIDSKSLQAMFKEVMAFPQTDPANIVTLHQLGLPLNEENIAQLENYQNLQHQLMQGMTDILAELPAAFGEVLAANGEKSAAEMYQALLALFLENGVSGGEEAAILQAGEEIAAPQDGEIASLPLEGEAAVLIGEAPEEGAPTGVENGPEAVLSQGEDGSVPTESKLPLNTEERNTLAKLFSEFPEEAIPDKKDFLADIRQGTVDTKDVLELLARTQPQTEEAGKALSDILKSPEFQKLFQAQVLDQWSLKPEELMQDKKVEELYEKLNRQLDNMKEILQNSGAGQTAAAKNAGNLSQNLDFMNQMNNLYTYVQLPLKMAGKQTNGDLYVYTNKRSLARKDGNVSALLHLDMENLGPVDVYIAMQQTRVTTRFTVRDDDMLDFLNDNMHILNERLEKKGYSMRCEMTVRVEADTASPIEHILNTDKNNTVLAQYGFDVRT